MHRRFSVTQGPGLKYPDDLSEENVNITLDGEVGRLSHLREIIPQIRIVLNEGEREERIRFEALVQRAHIASCQRC